MDISSYFSQFIQTTEGKFLIDILLAMVFGYLIGAERESRGKMLVLARISW